jgi:hypothetical protein
MGTRMKKDKYGYHRDKHPGYGMLSLSRVTGKFDLFGSKINHDTCIMLQLRKAEKESDEYVDHYFPKETIAEVFLSAAQFTNLLTSFNTSGVPCTIRYTDKEGMIENIPETPSLKNELNGGVTSFLSDLKKKVHELQLAVDNIKKGTVRKAQKERIYGATLQVSNTILSNLQFLEKCQMEKIEHSVTEAAAEAEALITNVIRSAGIEAIKDKQTKKLK